MRVRVVTNGFDEREARLAGLDRAREACPRGPTHFSVELQTASTEYTNHLYMLNKSE